MVTLTDDGFIFLHDCRPSSHLAILGYTGNYCTRLRAKYTQVRKIIHVLLEIHYKTKKVYWYTVHQNKSIIIIKYKHGLVITCIGVHFDNPRWMQPNQKDNHSIAQ